MRLRPTATLPPGAVALPGLCGSGEEMEKKPRHFCSSLPLKNRFAAVIMVK
jgi:hypothetical protein